MSAENDDQILEIRRPSWAVPCCLHCCSVEEPEPTRSDKLREFGRKCAETAVFMIVGAFACLGFLAFMTAVVLGHNVLF